MVQPWSEKLERFSQLEEVFLKKDKRALFQIASVKRFKGNILLRLKEITEPKQAEMWVGSLVEMPVEKLSRLRADEYYVHDLLGLAVYTEDKVYLGQIESILPNPGNDIFSVTDGEKTFYIPATKEAVVKVDLSAKQVTVKGNFVVEQ